MEFPSVKKPAFLNTPKLIPVLALVLIFLTVFPLYYPFRCTDHPEELPGKFVAEKSSRIYTPVDQPKGVTAESSVELNPPKQPQQQQQQAENITSVNLSPPQDLPKGSSAESSGLELHPSKQQVKNIGAESLKKCDIFTGEWVPNPDAPYYTNNTCYSIQEHQNCMKFGRPDNGYLKWKWKPDGCELPIFDPREFLELVRGKSLAFVGDSIARNHMQSLVCLLSRVN